MSKPNILLIMTDQQRWDSLGCVSPWMRTPNLDRIARDGVRFTNCVTNAPVCVPARRAMASGLYPHITHVWNNRATSLDTPTWVSAVREAGYRTSLFGKTHLNAPRRDLRIVEHLLQSQGLDDVNETVGPRGCTKTLSHMTAEWERLGIWEAFKQDFAERFTSKPHLVRPSTLGVEHYYDTYVGRKARDYLEAYDRSQPWFCWVSFGGPHEPWDAPEPYASAYDAARMPEPLSGNFTGGERARGALDARLEVPPPLTPEDVQAMRANYAGNVTLIDDMIGEIFKTIDARGEMANTVIALVSDHGEMNGDYGLLYKSNFLDSAALIPFLIRTPVTAAESRGVGVPSRTCASPIEWFDLGPTLVELAGGAIAHRQFARSLVPCLRDPAWAVREESLCELAGEVMVRDTRWKLAVNKTGHPYLLFDLQHDPRESRNLAGLSDYGDVETRLRLKMLERVIEAQLT